MAIAGYSRIVGGALLAVVGLALAPLGALAQPAPSNDNFANAEVFNGSSETTNVTYGFNGGATRENGEPNRAGSYYGGSVWWRWTATTTRSISISTEGSSFDTLLAVYTGSSITNLATVTYNDDTIVHVDPANVYSSRVLFRAIAGETYYIAVDGVQGDTGNIKLTITPAGITANVFWESVDIHGQPLQYRNLMDRGVLLIDFWSISCPPCLEELPRLQSLQDRWGSSGFQAIGLFRDTTTTEVEGVVAGIGIHFPMAPLTTAMEIPLANLQPNPTPTIQAFPTTYIYDKENRLVFQILDGAKDYSYFETLILPLLRSSSSIQLKGNWSADGLRLSWFGADKGDLLESTTDLSSTNWSQVLNIYGQTDLTVPPDQGTRFYRIRRP